MILSREEKRIISNALQNGLPILEDTNVEDLTLKIWESISRMPYPIESSFNIMGNSSIVSVINEEKDNILEAMITQKDIQFRLPKAGYKRSRADSVAATFAAMSIVGIVLNTCK